jgi:glyoxylase-like metal-dependent hydrolase (beta-lactamase superfamily II)
MPFILPFTILPCRPDGYLEGDQTLSIGSIKVETIFTPGHSPGHVSFYLPEHGILIGGDLIIMNAIGRTDLPDSNGEQMSASIRRIMQLPPDTLLLPGHGNTSTLADEKETNPYVQMALDGQPL